MRTIFHSVMACSAAVSLGFLSSGAFAEAAAKPLVVVRFNQPHVYYDQQLYGAVAQAVQVKPDVTFDIVSNAPSTGDATLDAQWITTASRNTQAVVATMKSIGVPMERMRVTGQMKTGLRYDETYIFAK